MSWPAELAAAKRELTNLLKGAIAQLFVYTLTAKASAIGDKDSIEASDDAKAPGAAASEGKPQRSVVCIQPFGFNGVPPRGVRSLTLQLGRSNLLFIGIAPTKAYGPQGLDVGEAAVYAEPGQTFVLDKNGNLIATPAGSGTVQLGGNSHKAILDTILTDLATALGFIAASNSGGPIITNPTSFAQFITNLTSGTYQSTQVQNG